MHICIFVTIMKGFVTPSVKESSTLVTVILMSVDIKFSMLLNCTQILIYNIVELQYSRINILNTVRTEIVRSEHKSQTLFYNPYFPLHLLLGETKMKSRSFLILTFIQLQRKIDLFNRKSIVLSKPSECLRTSRTLFSPMFEHELNIHSNHVIKFTIHYSPLQLCLVERGDYFHVCLLRLESFHALSRHRSAGYVQVFETRRI